MRQNLFVRSGFSVVLAAILACFSSDLGAGSPAVPKKLTPETFDAIRARVKLTPEDLAWQKVHWRNGFFEGIVDAQAADKPLFFWFYGGGPTGNC